MSDSKQSLKESFGKKDLLYIAMVVLSSAIYSFGMNTFVKSGNLFPSGYAGIARLISQVLINYTRFH
ncbi:MAG: YitT family protein, partial [Bulleidia sp.]